MRATVEIALPTLVLVGIGLFVLSTQVARSAPVGNGDANGDQTIDVADVLYLLAYLFDNGDPPLPIVPSSVNVPIGTVMPWHPPDPGAPLPGGFVLCDGSEVSDIASPLFGETLPDMLGRFAVGTEDADSVGQVVGGDQHSHTSSHSHDVSLLVPCFHNQHDHLAFEMNTALVFNSGDGQQMIDYADGVNADGSGFYPISVFSVTNFSVRTAFSSGTILVPQGTSGTSTSTDAVLSPSPNEPPHVNLVYLIRIK